jgi:hypothetical protein
VSLSNSSYQNLWSTVSVTYALTNQRRKGLSTKILITVMSVGDGYSITVSKTFLKTYSNLGHRE